MQAGRGLSRTQLEWLTLHGRAQLLADALCGTEHFALAHDLASDPDLPLAAAPVLLRWAREVVARAGHDMEGCLAHLRARLDGARGVPWATVAGYALVRTCTCVLRVTAMPAAAAHYLQLMRWLSRSRCSFCAPVKRLHAFARRTCTYALW